MQRAITVSHAVASYPVYVEPGILGRLNGVVAEHLPDRRVAMIADATVYQLYQAGHWGPVSWTGDTLRVPAGEASKTRESWAHLSDALFERGFGRDSGLIGLGGGMVGDLTGFVAATYMRGLPYVLAPTTLLAMVDASVGGKTGVNTSHGKNLIGAFHPPAAVAADPLALVSLPAPEYRGGLAEAVKHGLIADGSYFEWIEAQAEPILQRDPQVVAQLVRRSVQIKADVVGQDEREAGRRAILNAGHTVAHALEAASSYQLSHGEAVALGLVAECELGVRLHVTDPQVRERLTRLLARLGLPVRLPSSLDLAAVIGPMGADKKNRKGQIHCALITTFGAMHQRDGWTTAVSLQDMRVALETIV